MWRERTALELYEEVGPRKVDYVGSFNEERFMTEELCGLLVNGSYESITGQFDGPQLDVLIKGWKQSAS